MVSTCYARLLRRRISSIVNFLHKRDRQLRSNSFRCQSLSVLHICLASIGQFEVPPSSTRIFLLRPDDVHTDRVK